MHYEDIARIEEGSPLRLLSRLNRMNQNALAGPLAGIGIARGTLPFVMEALCREGVNQEEISRSLTIDRAATARALQQLEKDGLVERVEDSRDRRQKRVYATDRSRELSADILAILNRQRETLFAGFDDEERAQFLAMLERMVGNMTSSTQT